MLDPKLLRESPETVRAAIARKHLDADLDAVLALDTAWRTALMCSRPAPPRASMSAASAFSALRQRPPERASTTIAIPDVGRRAVEARP